MTWPFRFSTRTITAPASNDTKDVTVVDCWSVRWCGGTWTGSIDDKQYFWNRREHVEVFLNAQDAEAFATSLRHAFDLLRLRGSQKITLQRESRT